MKADELKSKLSKLGIWKKNGQRAPHKPLLVLYALAQLQRQNSVLPYIEVREKLKKLLFEFGPPRKSYHPEQPFVRLTTDGIWNLNVVVDKNNFSDQQLLVNQVTGGFQAEILLLLQKNNRLVAELAEQILQEHFPETMHADIVEEIGLDLVSVKKRPRDVHFRDRILKAYEHSCAVCGFNVRIGNNLIAIDAAHIQWHQSGGPDVEENGIALCSLHHKLFDRGAFTITNEHKLIVAEDAHGTTGFEEWLMRYHGTKIREPIHPNYQPRDNYIDWHLREVFRSPGRTTCRFRYS